MTDEMKRLLEERCDCVLSIRAATTCWRCRQIDWNLAALRELEEETKIAKGSK